MNPKVVCQSHGTKSVYVEVHMRGTIWRESLFRKRFNQVNSIESSRGLVDCVYDLAQLTDVMISRQASLMKIWTLFHYHAFRYNVQELIRF